MKPPPAFQFYPDDFLGGTMNFSDAEVGLYIRLLCVQWSTGWLPDNDEELLSYGKGGTPIHRVKAKFNKCADGKLRNLRLESVRKKQNDFRKSRVENGRLGGRPAAKPSANLVVLKTKAKKSSPTSKLLTPSPSTFVSSEARKREQEVMKEFLALIGQKNAANYGGLWRKRYRENPEKFLKVLGELGEKMKTDSIENPGGYADDLWRNRFL